MSQFCKTLLVSDLRIPIIAMLPTPGIALSRKPTITEITPVEDQQ
jgi:hypothetical protein